MGLKKPRWVYLDACLVIYFLEAHPRFGAATRQAIESAGDRRFCISPLVELECLVVPLREGNHKLVERYEAFFQHQQILDIEAPVFRQAAELRARHRLKTPDALHLATARYHGCAEIWTNDDRLNQAAGMLAVNVLAGT
jgi:predicted nucleic acid-binding protein